MVKLGSQSVFLRLVCLLLLGLVTASLGQTNPERELQSRLRAAAEAQQTGDPVAISQANRRLIAFALSQVAEFRQLQGDFGGAADLLGRAIDFEDASDLRYRYAYALNSAGQIDAALKQAAILVEQDPNNAAAWGMQGRLLTTKKKYKEATESLSKSIALQPDPEATYVMASDYLYLQETAKADAIFQKMEQSGINPARVHVMAGRAYEEANLPSGAEREYKKAIELDPRSHAHYFLGLFYLSRNGWEPTPKAHEEFAAEVAVNPSDFFGNYFLGYLASQDKDYDESDKYLRVAAAARPDWPEPPLYMGLNAYGRGNNSSAEELLRKAIQLTGNDESRNNYQIRRAYFTLGRILIQTGRKEEGTPLVEKSKAMETKLVVDSRTQALDQKTASAADAPATTARQGETPSGRAATLTSEQKSQISTAEKSLSAILGNAYNDLGTSEARRNDFATALTHFREAEKWHRETQGLERNIGLAAFLAGDYEECARAMREVVQRDPSDRRSMSMLAMSLYMLKNYPEAAKVFDHIPDEVLADPRMSYAWAYTLSETKDRQRAIEVLGKLTAQTLPAEMLVRAGKLYRELGDQANAQVCYQKAREQNPNIELPQ
jgi:tetratricopeptide (TPR) repeat protein